MKIKMLLLAIFVSFVGKVFSQSFRIVYKTAGGSYYNSSGSVSSAYAFTPGTLVIPNDNPTRTSGKMPVLLVHGFQDAGSSMIKEWDKDLKNYNGGVKSAYITTTREGYVNTNASYIKRAVDYLTKHFSTPEISIIAHSRGGVDTDMAMYRYNAARKVDGVYTFGSPHRGGVAPDLISSGVYTFFDNIFSFPLSSNSTTSFNTAYMSYYYSHAPSYVAQKKVGNSIVNVNPKTDTYTRWWYHYGDDYFKNGRWYYNVSGFYINTVINLEACGPFVIFGCTGEEGNDGVVENRSSKRNVMTNVGSSFFVVNNGDHVTLKNEGSAMDNEVLPFLPYVGDNNLENKSTGQDEDLSTQLKLKTADKFREREERDILMESNSRIIYSLDGQKSFFIDEENIQVNLSFFTENTSFICDIENIETGEKFAPEVRSEMNDGQTLFPGSFVNSIELSNLPKGKYSINVGQPFIGFYGSKDYSTQVRLDFGFKDSEGFRFDTNKAMKMYFSDNSTISWSSLNAKATVRKIGELDGSDVLKNTEFVYSFSPNDESGSLDAKISDNLASGFYNVTVEVDGGDASTGYVSRTFIRTFYVEREESGISPNATNSIFNVYPNPAGNNVSVTLNVGMKTSGLANVELFSITGQKLKSIDNYDFNSNILDLNTSSLKDGMYVLKVYVDGEESTHKIVIKH